MIDTTQMTKSLGAAGLLLIFGTALAAQTVPSATPPPTEPTEVQQPNTPPQQQMPNQPGPTTRAQTQPTQPPDQTNPPNSPMPPNQIPAQNQTNPPTPPTPPTPTTTIPPMPNVGTSGGVAPAVLPADPPPVAPDFQAPPRPLPSAERVGVDVSDQMPLSLPEAVTLALQNNNDIDSSRIGVQIAEFNLRAARGVYDPVIVSENYYERRTTPTASTIGGASAAVRSRSRIWSTALTSTDFRRRRADFTRRISPVRGRRPTARMRL